MATKKETIAQIQSITGIADPSLENESVKNLQSSLKTAIGRKKSLIQKLVQLGLDEQDLDPLSIKDLKELLPKKETAENSSLVGDVIVPTIENNPDQPDQRWLNDRKDQISKLRSFSVPIPNEFDGLFISLDRGIVYANNVPVAWIDGRNGSRPYITDDKGDQEVITTIYDQIRKRLDQWIDTLFTSRPLYDLVTHGIIESVTDEMITEQNDRIATQVAFRESKKKLSPKPSLTLEERIAKENDRRDAMIAKRKSAKALISTLKGKY